MEAELREGEPTATRPFRLLYAKGLVFLQPALHGPGRGNVVTGIAGDSVIVTKEGEAEEIRPSFDCPTRNE